MKKVLEELKEQVLGIVLHHCPEYEEKNFYDGVTKGIDEAVLIIDVKIKEEKEQETSLRGMTELMFLSKINDLLIVAEERQKRIEELIKLQNERDIFVEDIDKETRDLKNSVSALKRSLSACIDSMSALRTELDEKNMEIEKKEDIISLHQDTIRFQNERVKEQYVIIEKLKDGGVIKILKREILSVLKEGEDTEDYAKGYKDCYGNVISILDEF